jgi:eukaryotic-like serine/threonine-protein kinase
MELCPGNTLKEVVHQPGLLQEELIFSYFYQLMAGYRVLWRAGIVHQDLKLANVLIKKNTLKITDFGFSILAERYKATLTREGTLHYMPYEKLTDPEYLADERSDIYSMGVMMFEIITKAHPFVNQKSIKTQKDFVIALRSANILKPKLYVTYSLELQKLFDLVIRMCAKNIKHRASCP